VSCRIVTRRENNRLVVHLAGRLGEAQVPELLEVCEQSNGPPLLELDELVSADGIGIDALRRIEEQGAELVGMPQYMRLKLDVLAREQKS
jgi:hypothetical protein